MTLPLIPESIIRCITIIFFFHLSTSANAFTYQLSYDRILGSNFPIDCSSNETSSKYGEQTFLSENLAKKLITDIGKEIISRSTEEIALCPNSIDFEPFCRRKKSFRTLQDNMVCDMELEDENISIEIILKLYSHDKEVEKGSIRAKLRVAISILEDIARKILVDCVPMINNLMHACDLAYEPVWEISPRPSSFEIQTLVNTKASVETLRLSSNDMEYSTIADASSLDLLILSNPIISHKEMIAKHDDLEVWKYMEFGSSNFITSLFIKSNLYYTTKFGGSAHAEAFVHPVLISHPNPVSVAVISRTPFAIGFEILKHKSVQQITVFDSNKAENDFFMSSFPHLNDCSSMENRKTSCIDSMNFVYENEQFAEEQFDVIFLDLSSNSSDYATYLSMPVMDDILFMMKDDENSSVIINVGSAPSDDLTQSEDIHDDDYRGNFLHMITRSEKFGGLEVQSLHVYDEPKATPLDSSFIMITGSASTSKTYHRFFRRNPAAIDLDIAETMYPPPPSSLSYISTIQYDGPTHYSYITPSRSWERWYCSKKPWKNMPVCTEFMTKFYDTKYHASSHSIEVRIDPIKGRTLYAAEDIPKGHLILPRDAANSISLDEDHWNAFAKFIKDVPSASLFESMYYTIEGYGFESAGYGFSGYAVTTTPNSFMNHGCTEYELNANPMINLFFDEDGLDTVYFSPLFLRRSEMYSVHVVASRNIKKGEEILFDYRFTQSNQTLHFMEEDMCSKGKGAFNSDNQVVLGVENDEVDEGERYEDEDS